MNVKVSKILTKAKFAGKVAAPYIMVGAGVIGFGAACYTAVKKQDEVNYHIEALEYIKEYSPDNAQAKKDALKRLGLSLAPTVALSISSAVCIVGAAAIMTNEIRGLASSLTLIQAQQALILERVNKDKGKKAEKVIKPYDYSIKNGKEIVTSDVYDALMISDSLLEKTFENSKHFKNDYNVDSEYIYNNSVITHQLAMDQGYITYNQVMDIFGFYSMVGGDSIGWTWDKFNIEDYSIYTDDDIDTKRLMLRFSPTIENVYHFTEPGMFIEDDDMYDNCDGYLDARSVAMCNVKDERAPLIAEQLEIKEVK